MHSTFTPTVDSLCAYFAEHFVWAVGKRSGTARRTGAAIGGGIGDGDAQPAAAARAAVERPAGVAEAFLAKAVYGSRPR